LWLAAVGPLLWSFLTSSIVSITQYFIIHQFSKLSRSLSAARARLPAVVAGVAAYHGAGAV